MAATEVIGDWTTERPLRIAVLGMPCDFTRQVVSAASAANAGEHTFDLQAIVLAGRNDGDQAPARTDPAWPEHVPLEAVGSRAALMGPAFRKRIATLAPDLIVVACFPWRISRAIRTIPRCGCLNVHPSLLPEGRGPEPVFWAIRRGLRRTGVTIHRMDDGLDTGPILAQRVAGIDAVATITSLETDLAKVGGHMLHAVVRDLGRGIADEREQPPGEWPAAPFPVDRDLIATTEWSASRVASYIRAVAPTLGPVPIWIVASGRLLPHRAGSVDMLAADDHATQAEPLVWDGDSVRIRCTPGVIAVGVPRQSMPLILHSPVAPRSG